MYGVRRPIAERIGWLCACAFSTARRSQQKGLEHSSRPFCYIKLRLLTGFPRIMGTFSPAILFFKGLSAVGNF